MDVLLDADTENEKHIEQQEDADSDEGKERQTGPPATKIKKIEHELSKLMADTESNNEAATGPVTRNMDKRKDSKPSTLSDNAANTTKTRQAMKTGSKQTRSKETNKKSNKHETKRRLALLHKHAK